MASVTNKIINVYTQIDELFSLGQTLSVQELIDRVTSEDGKRISQAQMYRYLKDMKENFHAPIVTVSVDGELKKKYETSKTMFLPSYIVKAENFKFLNVVKNLLSTIEETPIHDDAEKVFDELSMIQKNTETRVQESDNFDRVIFLGAPSAHIRNEVYDKIYEAMEKNKQLRITYKRDENTEEKDYGLCPYQLIYDNGTWDLWAYDQKAGRKKFFNLCRILKAEIPEKSDSFVLPNDFDFRKATPGNFGCYIDQNEGNVYGKTNCVYIRKHYKIRFRKGSYAANFVLERKWGENTTHKEDGDFIDVEFDSNQEVLILKWVLGWGEDAIPVEPESLVEEWKRKVSIMAENLKKMTL